MISASLTTVTPLCILCFRLSRIAGDGITLLAWCIYLSDIYICPYTYAFLSESALKNRSDTLSHLNQSAAIYQNIYTNFHGTQIHAREPFTGRVSHYQLLLFTPFIIYVSGPPYSEMKPDQSVVIQPPANHIVGKSLKILRNVTSNHAEEFLNGWVSGIYSGYPCNDPARCLYRDREIDCPDFAPPIVDARRYEEHLRNSADGAAMDSFNRGWVCGAARGWMPLKDIVAKTGISERDIQQIVIQDWGMIWKCSTTAGQHSRTKKNPYDYCETFSFDRLCSTFCEAYILSEVKEFLEILNQRRYSFEDMTGFNSCNTIHMDTGLETQTILRDIRCAIVNGLDIGMLFTIARIKWVKKRCRECKGRRALGNSTWMVRCISRRCESTSSTYKCNCLEDDGTVDSEATGYSEWSGLYQPVVTDGTIRDATAVPPRRLWDVVTNRVILFGGKVSSLCQWCYDMVSFPCLLVVAQKSLE